MTAASDHGVVTSWRLSIVGPTPSALRSERVAEWTVEPIGTFDARSKRTSPLRCPEPTAPRLKETPPP